MTTNKDNSCLRSEYDEQYDGWCELAACEIREEAVVWVERPGVHNTQHVEGTTHGGFHHNGETKEATLLELRRGVPTRVTQVNPEHQDKDFTWRPSFKWTVRYKSDLNISNSYQSFNSKFIHKWSSGKICLELLLNEPAELNGHSRGSHKRHASVQSQLWC